MKKKHLQNRRNACISIEEINKEIKSISTEIQNLNENICNIKKTLVNKPDSEHEELWRMRWKLKDLRYRNKYLRTERLYWQHILTIINTGVALHNTPKINRIPKYAKE